MKMMWKKLTISLLGRRIPLIGLTLFLLCSNVDGSKNKFNDISEAERNGIRNCHDGMKKDVNHHNNMQFKVCCNAVIPSPSAAIPDKHSQEKNLLSGVLSRLERGGSIPSNESRPPNMYNSQSLSSPSMKDKKKGGVRLDLSGKLDCLLCTKSETNRNSAEKQVPLFQLGHRRSNNPLYAIWPAAIHAGAHYNFDHVWYGATRLLSTFRWGDTGSYDNQGWLSRTIQSVKLGVEKGLFQPNDYSTQFTLLLHPLHFRKKKNNNDNGDDDYVLYDYEYEENLLNPSLNLRWDTKKEGSEKVSMNIRYPIHRRLDVESNSIILLRPQYGGEESLLLSSRMPRRSIHELFSTSQDEDDGSVPSWFPDFRLTGTGRLHCQTEASFPPPDNRYGIRIAFSHQMDWNAIGLNWNNNGFENEGGGPIMKFEILGLNKSNILNSITMSTLLGRMRKSTKFTLRQDRTYSLK